MRFGRASSVLHVGVQAGGGVSFRDDGDRLRDAGKKAEAAEAYGAHLAQVPDDFEIWVQRGNCLKDAGQHAAALAAYERAVALRPDDADVHLQIGHAHKLQGTPAHALKAYERSMSITPTVAAAAEISRLKGSPADTSAFYHGTGIAYLYLIDDFFNYLKHHATLSGIQRVQAGLIQSLTNQDADGSHHFVIAKENNAKTAIAKVDTFGLCKLVDIVSSTNASHDEIRALVYQLEGEAVQLDARTGDVLCIIGAFWNSEGIGKYRAFIDAGFVIGAYIYDLIPITHPEFCDKNLCTDFLLALSEGLRLFSFILTISDYTAKEVSNLIDRYDIPRMPIKAVPLAHELTGGQVESLGLVSPQVAAFEGRKYALFVSTIEGRKNHGLVVAAWQAMIREGLDPPDIVFVGRRGWRVSGLFDLLDATDNLGGKVHILHDLTDLELRKLYQWCRFTVFPSFVEGWGLPVGESLVAGRPCVASNTSSIPEVGGDFVDYVDPLDVSGSVKVLKKLCFDDSYVQQRAAAIQDEFALRTWADVGTDFVLKMQDCVRELGQQVTRTAWVDPGEAREFRPSQLRQQVLADEYFRTPLRLVLHSGWYGIEDFGVWMRGQTGNILVQTSLAPGDEVYAIICLVTPPWAQDAQVHCQIGQANDQARSGSKHSWTAIDTGRTLRVSGRVDKASQLKLIINLRKPPSMPAASNSGDNRIFDVGLTSFAYVGVNSVGKRLELLEGRVFG